MVKVRALAEFEKYTDKERDVRPTAGEVWETTELRAAFLVQKGVCEYVEEKKIEKPVEVKEEIEVMEEVETIEEEKPKRKSKKKTIKKN